MIQQSPKLTTSRHHKDPSWFKSFPPLTRSDEMRGSMQGILWEGCDLITPLLLSHRVKGSSSNFFLCSQSWSLGLSGIVAPWNVTSRGWELNNATSPPFYYFNPLTPEWNPSAQRCLTRLFTGDFASWTVHFVNTWLKNQQIHQLFIQFINYVS
jgi:hypothetical protein